MTNWQLVTSPVKRTRLRLNLLNEAQWEEQSLEGYIIDMSLSVTSKSDIRRTSTVTLYIDEDGSTLMNNLWLNKTVSMYLGIYDKSGTNSGIDENGYVWFLLGWFMISNNGYQWQAQTRQLSVSLVDMMADLTAERGSQIGYAVELTQGSSMKDAYTGTINRYSRFRSGYHDEGHQWDEDGIDINDLDGMTIPYDLEINSGSYPVDVLHALLDLYPYYEMFYTKNGVFTVRKIPTTYGNPALTAEQMRQIIISESGDILFSDIKNVTEIWGKSLTASYMASAVTRRIQDDNLIYNLYFSQSFHEIPKDGNMYSILENNAKYGFTVPKLSNENDDENSEEVSEETSTRNVQIEIDANDVSGAEPVIHKILLPLYNQAGDGTLTQVTTGEILAGRVYVIRYVEVSVEPEEETETETEEDPTPAPTIERYFVLQGLAAIHAMCFEYNTMPSAQEVERLKRFYNCEDIRFFVNQYDTGEGIYAAMVTNNDVKFIDKTKEGGNPISPFAVDYQAEHGALGNGEIVQVLQGGDYSDIYTSELALERATYENWKKTRLNDTIQLEALFVPWLEVNTKIEYTSLLTGETHEYLIQEIKANLQTFTMDLTLQKFYPFYPWEGGNA